MVTSRRSRLAGSIALTLLTAGCIDVEEFVTLRADGSGKSHVTILMGAMAAEFAGSFAGRMRVAAQKAIENRWIQSWKVIEDTELSNGGRRIIVEYSFDDISRLGNVSVAALAYEQRTARIWSADHELQGTVKANSIEPGGSYTIKIRFPGNVEATNGVRENSSLVSWFFDGGTEGRLWATVTDRSLSPIRTVHRLWSAIEEWMDRESMAVQVAGDIEIRFRNSVIHRREQGGWIWTSSGRLIGAWTTRGFTVVDAAGEQVFEGLELSGFQFHPNEGAVHGVVSKGGDFSGLLAIDLATGEQWSLSFLEETYDRPRTTWLGRQIAYRDPSSERGAVRLWNPRSGATQTTRCEGIIMGASRGQILLTGSVYSGRLLVFGPLRWCDPGTGRGDRVSTESGWQEVLDISPSGELLAIARQESVLITDRAGRHRRVFDVGKDLPIIAEGATPAFVRWASNSRRIVAGYAGWEGDHQTSGPAWLIDVETGEIASLGNVGNAAFIVWPRWPGVSRGLLKMTFYAVVILCSVILVAVVFWLGQMLLIRGHSQRLNTRAVKCASCGEEISRTARFCRHCGTKRQGESVTS